MIDWNRIDTVLLDMDGTLLDLHYDNHFWLAHVPMRYAEKHGISSEQAGADLLRRYQAAAGTLNWYSVDYWTNELGLDIAALKQEVAHLVAIHPHAETFLGRLRRLGKRVALVTNAHYHSLSLKLRLTGLAPQFDVVVCAHDLGLAKEHEGFWSKLRALEVFDPESTLLVDDSLPVLQSARDFGIAYLLAVKTPDSRQPPKDTGGFSAISSFLDIMP